MSKLDALRKQYPQYNDMSDVDLANAYHKKYYSDIPQEDFYKKIGLSIVPEESFASKLPRNILAGMAQMGHGLINTPHNIAGLFSESLSNRIPFQEEQNFAQMLGQQGEGTLADKLVQGFAQYAPALAIPGAQLGRAGEAIGAIPKVGGFLTEAASQAVPQSIFGATQTENPLQGAAEGALGAGIGAALGRGIESLRPSKLLRGELSPEELAHNLEVTKGTETGLGRVIESPTLMRLQENVLPYTIGSGAEKTMQRNAANIQSKGEDLLNKVHGEVKTENYANQLQDALKTASKEARNEKNAMYDKLNNLAETHNLTIGRDNFQAKAQDILSNIKQSPELEGEFGKDLYKDIERYARNPKGNNLKLTNIFRGKLGDKANELYLQGKSYESGLLNELKDSLTEDIDQSFNKTGNKELKDAYTNAQKNYREKFAPFEDKDIVKFTKKGGDPELILSHFLKGGRNDRSNLLLKISKAVQQQHPKGNMLSSAYLSQAMDETGKLNPVKFKALYDRLGKNQKKVLFGDMHKDIKNYSDLVAKNMESFNLMFNPQTGKRNTELLAKLAQLGSGMAHGGGLGTNIGLPLAIGLAGKIANKVLTNEGYRDKLINAMLRNQQLNLGGVPKAGAFASELYGEKNKPMELELTTGRRY